MNDNAVEILTIAQNLIGRRFPSDDYKSLNGGPSTAAKVQKGLEEIKKYFEKQDGK